MLKGAGYATAIFGKWHLGYDVKRFGPTQQGFDTFEGFVSGNVDYFNKIDQEGHKDWWIGEELKHVDGYVTDLINDRGVAWIARQQKENKDKPFFLYLAHGAPHYPLQGPDDKGFRVVGKKIREMPDDPKAAYKAMIESMDAGIGRVVAELEKQGIRENTLVIFCSDNGQAGRIGSAGPLRGSKGTVYEGGHRVPMVMSWPRRLRKGNESDATVIGMDFYAMFADAAGAELPEGVKIDGMRLDELAALPEDRPRTLHWVHGDKHAMRRGPWKLVVNGNAAPQLFNLADDLGEQTDLADTHPDRVRQMHDAHKAWLTEMRKDANKVS